jgi:hypothetical protein
VTRDEAMPFCVSYSTSLGSEHHDECFATKEEAVARAERVLQNFRCVWLGVYAKYENEVGNWDEDWVWFWWSDAVTDDPEWGPCPDAGECIPDQRRYRTRYR